MTKVRQHRGNLSDSMETVCEVQDFDQLLAVVRESLEPFGQIVSAETVHVEPYTWDARIGWETHLVTIDGYGVWGMTDGMLEAGKKG